MKDENYLDKLVVVSSSQNVKERTYWLNVFSQEPVKTNFPYDVNKLRGNGRKIEAETFRFSDDFFSRLHEISKGSDVRLFIILATGILLLLNKYTNNKDIVVGAPIYKQKIKADFINTVLALRSTVKNDMNFRELILHLGQVVFEAIENQNYPIESLLYELDISFSKDDDFPLFDVAVLLKNIHDIKFIQHINLNIIFSFLKKNGYIEGILYYNSLRYNKKNIERIINSFLHLLGQAIFNVNSNISNIEIILEEEKKQVLYYYNDTEALYPRDKTIHELFELQVEKSPDNTAVVDEDGIRSMSYIELNERSNQLARVLRGKGVGPGTIVGIMVERSLEMVVGILGILKAGGAYLPIDLEYPSVRRQFILEDSAAKVLLTNKHLFSENKKILKHFILEDILFIEDEGIYSGNHTNLEVLNNSKDLVYIMYTSGTTGNPKGVMIEHQGLVNYIWWAIKNYVKNEDVDFPLYTSISFDLTITSIFVPLLTGNSIVVYGEEDKEFIIEKIIEDNKVGVIKLTPSHLKLIRDKKMTFSDNSLGGIFKCGIKRFIVGGEELDTQLAGDIYTNFDGKVEIYNEYGPTEAVVGCMLYKFEPEKVHGKSVPIGVPADNTQIYILDKNQSPVPIGALGELCVSGDGIARGYLGREDWTLEKFLINPFIEGGRLYRTGDLARWLPDGNMEFLGRIDHQVKIRGFRIELGEIESRILSFGNVSEAVVISKENANREKYLCAYVVSDKDIKISELREYLSEALPEYMIPPYMMHLNRIPLTPNGKVDRRALPEPEVGSGEDYVGPRNDTEVKLVEIWERVLGRENIGVNDNFFLIGGDSIKSIQIVSRMKKEGYEFRVKDIFELPTIAKLASKIRVVDRTIDQSIVTGKIPLIPIQKWYFENDFIDTHHFNQGVMLYSREGFEEKAIKAVFKKLQEHHDGLRMAYWEEDGKIIQTNMDLEYPLSLQIFDFRKEGEAIKLLESKANEIQSGINLRKGPLMKLGLFHLEDGDRLLIVIHHLVIDGISWRILFEDIETLYNQYKNGERLNLPLKSDSLKTWSEKLSNYANSKSFLKEKSYWKKLESMSVASITKDFDNKDNMVKDAGSLSFSLNKSDTQRLLSKVNKAFNTEINDILLTGLGLGIKKTFGNSQLLIALEGHGREEILRDIDISRTIGWFTSLYPVILDISFENGLSRQIKEVKEALHQIPNKGIGYGILRYLTSQEHKLDIEFTLDPRISFNYLGQFDADLKQTSFGIARESAGKMQSERRKRYYELDVSGMIESGKLRVSIVYNKKQFKSGTISKLIRSYEAELREIISFCTQKQETELTPSDFTYKGLLIEDVDKLQKEYLIEDIYTLSPMQEGMLFHALYDRNSSAYFEQISYRIHNELELDLIKKSLNDLIKRHDVLRTIFIHKGLTGSIQIVLKERESDLYYEDIRGRGNGRDKERFIKEFKEKDRHRSFELSKDILFRVSILQLARSEYELIWSFHHILMDGWCVGILIDDFLKIYNSYLENRAYNLPKGVPYRKYIEWLWRQDKEESKNYWKKYLENYEEIASIPKVAAVKSENQGYTKEEEVFVLKREKLDKLKDLAGRNQVTLNTIIQVIWGIILGKYNNKEDIVFGSVVSGRPSEIEGIESIIGLFINTIPVRIRFKCMTTFSHLLKNVQKEAIESESYHYYPLAEIQSESMLKQDLIDHIIIFENYPIAENIEGVMRENTKKTFKTSNVKIFEQSNYDFNIIIVPGDRIVIKFDYNANIYEKDFVKRISIHFKNLIDQILYNDQEIKEFTLLSEKERRQILYEFNDTESDNPRDKTIDKLFEEQVNRNPNNIALVYKDKQLTYSRLNKTSNQLAFVLREKGITSNSIVGMILDRSLEMIIGILGILKSGGAYLPIDPEFPEERIKYMFDDSNIDIILTDKDKVDDILLTDLKGYKKSHIVPYMSKKRQQIMEFDNIPIPDRSLVDYEKYIKYIGQGMVKNSITLQATRGCPYNCAYCCRVWPKKYVVRSAENIFEEVQLYYKMGVRRFVFIDDIFNLDIKNSMRFFELIIKNRLDIQMHFPSGLRGDILTKEYIDLMVKAGATSFPLALETASPRLQKLIRKNLDIEKLKENLEYIIEKHPHVILELHTMMGFPTETEEEAMMTLNFIKSLKWIHFPYIHILKIYSNTDMEKLALENGIPQEAINHSMNRAYHELPDTLPFSKGFALQYQSDFLNNYFLDEERLKHVLPHQTRNLTEDEIVQKYNSYLPVEIKSLGDLLSFLDIRLEDLGMKGCLNETAVTIKDFNKKLQDHFPVKSSSTDALKVLLLDISQEYSSEGRMLYDVVEQPLGLLYLMTYLYQQLGSRINGKVAKARIDFDSFEELRQMVKAFKPDVIGIRALTFYKDAFHKTTAMLRQWGFNGIIIAGGPYATIDYKTLLQDRTVDLAVLGEGETTFCELVEEIIKNNKTLPKKEFLRNINGISFISDDDGQSISGEKRFGREILMMDQLSEILFQKPVENLVSTHHPGNLAYVIFTSGSTGKSKGNLTTHKNVIRVVKETNYIQLKENDRILQLSNYSFDGSVFDIYGALLNNASLIMMDKGDIFKVDILSWIIKKEAVTVFFVTTALFNTLVDMEVESLDNVRNVLFGGERVSLEHTWKGLKYLGRDRIIHVYGPTETTVYATYYYVNEKQEIIPIGKPISNTTTYILDKNLKPVPFGAVGQICIGGDGLARGYLNNPELTCEKIIDDIFLKGERLYLTGDLGMWLPDGNIEFLGRMDKQVKIRGFRVELGEIESQLLKNELIRDAVVLEREEGGNKYLCAYIVMEEGLDLPDLRGYLSSKLPDYMIPSFFVKIDNIPLTPNGKVDRRAFPEPKIGAGDRYIAPRDKDEKKLVELWSEILRVEVENIGINSNFFELGGHSLRATILLTRIHKELDVRVPLAEIFRRPTIKSLSEYIKQQKKDKFLSIEIVENKEYYPLSFAQERQYILEHTHKHNTRNNVPRAFIIEGELDLERLDKTLLKLINRHESFRTSFEMIEGLPVQIIRKPFRIEFSIERCESNGEKDTVEIINRSIKSFDLRQAPLIRVVLIKEDDEKHILLFDMHHIITDGVSLSILKSEFNSLYNGEELPLAKLQYKDYSEWQHHLKESGAFKEQENYWREEIEMVPQVMNLHYDYKYEKPGAKGNNVHFSIVKDEYFKLKELVSKEGVTLFMILLAIYNIFLSKICQQEDIIVGTPIANRTNADLQSVIGLFPNTLILRNYPEGSKSFTAFLKEIKERTLKAFENQEYPFIELIKKLKSNGYRNRNSIFNVQFQFGNFEIPEVGIQGLKLKPYDFEKKDAKMDLLLSGIESKDRILLTLNYKTGFFKVETIIKFVTYIKRIISSVLDDPGKKLSKIEIISKDKRKEKYTHFNVDFEEED